MNELISIIIPAYNAEKYLDDCINSIVNQDYKNIEIIIINDGSTDKTEEIIKNHLGDTRIKYVMQKNSGVAHSRNVGINMSNGKYIMFVDADDKLLKNSISYLYEHLNKTDLIIGGYSYIGKTMNNKYKLNEYSTEDLYFIMKEIIYSKKKWNQINLRTVWGKLYLTDIIKKNEVKFVEGIKYFEDGIFNLDYIKCCKTVYITNFPIYEYRVNINSCINKCKTDLLEHDKNKINVIKDKFFDITILKQRFYCMFFEMFVDYNINEQRLNKNYSSVNDEQSSQVYLCSEKIIGLRAKHCILYKLYTNNLYNIFDRMISFKRR